MIFKKQSPRNYCSLEFGIEIRNCEYYSFIDDNQSIGHFYCTGVQSVGYFQDTKLLIEASGNRVFERVFNLKNLNNNAIVGEISISNFAMKKSLNTTVDIIHQEPYKWQIEKASKGFSLFTSKVWSLFSGKLYNNKEKAIFMWDYTSNKVYAYKLESLPVTGQIELSNPQNHFLLFVGLFLMEMELQMKAID